MLPSLILLSCSMIMTVVPRNAEKSGQFQVLMSQEDLCKRVWKVFENSKAERNRRVEEEYPLHAANNNLSELNGRTSTTSLERSPKKNQTRPSQRSQFYAPNRNVSPPTNLKQRKSKTRSNDTKDKEIELLIQILELALQTDEKSRKKGVDKKKYRISETEDEQTILTEILKLYKKSSAEKYLKKQPRHKRRIKGSDFDEIYTKTDSSEVSNNRSLSERINRILSKERSSKTRHTADSSCKCHDRDIIKTKSIADSVIEGNSNSKIAEISLASVVKDLVAKLNEVAEKFCQSKSDLGGRVTNSVNGSTGDKSEDESLSLLLHECLERNKDTQKILEALQKQIKDRIPAAKADISLNSHERLTHIPQTNACPVPHCHPYQAPPLIYNGGMRLPWWYYQPPSALQTQPTQSPPQRRSSSQETISRGCKHRHRHRCRKETSDCDDMKNYEKFPVNLENTAQWTDCNKCNDLNMQKS